MRVCEACKKEYNDDTVFCSQCGSKLVMKQEKAKIIWVHKCPSCGQAFPDNVRFCTQCGKELVDAEEDVTNLVAADHTMAASEVVQKENQASFASVSVSEMDTLEAEEKTEWEFSSRFLFRFAREAKVTAQESVLTIQKSVGFIYFAVLTLSRSQPVMVDAREITTVTLKERYSVWAGVFFFLALLCLEKENILAAIIFGIIGYVELKYVTITINYRGGSVEIGDSNSISSESVQGFLNYIKKYNPNCIQ